MAKRSDKLARIKAAVIERAGPRVDDLFIYTRSNRIQHYEQKVRVEF